MVQRRRTDGGLPPPGYAARLVIPAIDLDTSVQQGGIIQDERGELVWQTLPFVAVHYGGLTALAGAPGNAVIAGHVVTREFSDRLVVTAKLLSSHEARPATNERYVG